MKMDSKLPKKWTNYKLSDICRVNQGLQIPIAKRLTSPTEKSLVYITVQFLNGGSEAQYIEIFNDSVMCDKSDILMTRTGNTGLVITGVRGVFHNNFFKIKYDNKQTNREYLVYFFQSPKIQYRIRVLAGSSTIPDLNHGDFYSINILLPPLPEQKAIADLLSTWDEAIEKTERLIQAKEKRFKWLLRELISEPQKTQKDPKWEKVKLGDVFDIKTHTSKSKYITDGGCRYIVDMGSVSRDFRLITTKQTNLNIDLLAVGDLVMPKDDIGGGNIIGKVAVIREAERYVCGDHVYRLVQKRNYSIEFLYFLINSNVINRQLRAKSNGTSQLGLGKKDVQRQVLAIPSLKEQQEISNILNSVQNEIDLLKKLVEKYKTQKRVLMQKMLTGVWRVKSEIVKTFEE